MPTPLWLAPISPISAVAAVLTSLFRVVPETPDGSALSCADVPSSPVGFDCSSFFVDFGGSRFAVVDRAGLGERAAKCLLEDLDGALPHVKDLLVDGERERRVGVTHEVHRSARGHVAHGEH